MTTKQLAEVPIAVNIALSETIYRIPHPRLSAPQITAPRIKQLAVLQSSFNAAGTAVPLTMTIGFGSILAYERKSNHPNGGGIRGTLFRML
jgi:hypothetical protein